jgi:DNA-binding MarR family transcriptional regulator
VDADGVVRLRRAIQRLARQLNASATDEGLTPSQASVLALIVGHAPVTPSELARLEGLNPTMLSRVVGKLEDAGLVRRTPAPQDLRSATVSSTPAGRRRHERIKRQRSAVVSRCVARLPARDQQALTAALPALEQLVELLTE